MSSPAIDRLREIKTLPQLVAYLRDELDWPISSNNTEDITFDYEASELGLDKETAVKIKEIKQLRPLTGNQPWGIFFVNFEKKRLPVMVMRRILRSLVFKKRTSPGKSDRQAWHASDLLFISAYGEEHDRAITFAHFVEDEELGGLAELRVLGWDDDDTPLKYDYVAHTLHDKFRWRGPFERDPDMWRKIWRDAFELRNREVITTSKQLALSLAALAKKIRSRVRSILRYEDGFGQIRKLQTAFRKALIHDLSDDDFADMYAQTITYGLFSAAVSRPAGIRGENIVDMVPVTNPFLRDMLETFLNLSGRKGKIDFDELGIQEVTSLLNSSSTHLDAVLRDFDNRNPQEDPVIHFYELFLAEYDRKKKVQRGVFYTPKPVVSYIVRSVHELLQREFKLEDGLADTSTWGEMVRRDPGLKLPNLSDDPKQYQPLAESEPFVQILDPAVGTATFLVEVIDVIHRHLQIKWRESGFKAMPGLPATSFPRQPSDFSEYWNQYVALSLLPRLHGYELMMAPYAIAHMKVGLKLWETGYRFGANERARIYLTNSLEPPHDFSDRLAFDAPALAHEATAVNDVKRKKRFTAIVGNPPYAGISANMTETAQRLVEPYKLVDGKPLNERKLWLQDDYVKFIRIGQVTGEQARTGVLGYITNHSYLNNPTFRGMRRSLMQTFEKIRVLDLHGNANIHEVAPDRSKDENVFDIMQGVSIGLFIKRHEQSRSGEALFHHDLWGLREDKYEWLSANNHASHKWTRLVPNSPHYFFVPRNESVREEYEGGWSLPKMMPANGVGIITARDALTIDFDATSLWKRVARFSTLATEDARSEFDLGRDVQSWRVSWAQEDVRSSGPSRDLIRPVLYRPFDERVTYYTGQSSGFICRPVVENMRHMIVAPNLAIVTCRQIVSQGWRHMLTTDGLTENCLISNQSREGGYVFPVYTYPASNDSTGQLFRSTTKRFSRRPNFASKFITAMCTKIGLEFVDDREGDLAKTLGPEDIFHYAYAVFHSPEYRSRYAEFLKIDFPRLPLTGNLGLFRALAKLGRELVAVHLLESPMLDKPRTEFIGGRNPEVEKVSYSKNTVWIDKAQTVGFRGVPEEVWNFHIGGYQVCEKWLKDRKGRRLSKDDITHYHKIVIALSETIRIMSEIDKVIEKHGGWPGAFAGGTPSKKQ
jgi:predicted helicase